MDFKYTNKRPVITPCQIDKNLIPDESKQLNVLIQMKNDNKSNDTIRFTRKSLSLLAQHASLAEPESVKAYIAQKQVSDSYKRNLCIAYNKYCKYYGIKWEMPIYAQEAKIIKLPTKEKLLMLIASARAPLSIKLSISMEAGLRPVELIRLKLKDIDFDHRAIMPTTAKGGNPRAIKITQQLTAKIKEWATLKSLTPNDRLFHGTSANYGFDYREMRNRLATKLNDPTIRTIRLYDFRHYFCTKTLRDSNDVFFTMNQMGHKKLTTTQLYMHLVNLESDEWTCRAASTKDEAMSLIEGGFQYITDMEGFKLFKKRK
jgi:integrase